MALLATLLASACLLALTMAVAWLIQQRSGNSGWVDAAWSFGVGVSAIAGALIALTQSHANTTRVWIVIALAALWSGRLSWHIFVRSASIKDDPRYAELRRQWGKDAPRKMFIFLQQQAWASAPFVWAIVLAAWNPATSPAHSTAIGDICAIALLLFAIAMENTSDRQLRRFTTDPSNRGKICDAGLWSLSRHPNYFFQWLGWLAWPLMAINFNGTHSAGWLSLIAPVLMFYLLTRISGIPPLEEHMLRKHGEKYAAYQRRTPAFFPLGALASRATAHSHKTAGDAQ